MKYDFEYLPRALNMTNSRLAFVGPQPVRDAFRQARVNLPVQCSASPFTRTAACVQYLTAEYPGLSAEVLGNSSRGLNCTGVINEMTVRPF